MDGGVVGKAEVHLGLGDLDHHIALALLDVHAGNLEFVLDLAAVAGGELPATVLGTWGPCRKPWSRRECKGAESTAETVCAATGGQTEDGWRTPW